ncbi:MAG: hypothetical protein L6Q37_10670 [Bdellovibrionaceae bacterium]|nr:hypothetical protein [Pseudobdellovibrionaceae bacterium]
MTINKIKTIIVLSILLMLGGAVSMKVQQQNKTLRVAFPMRLKSTAYEPTNINFDYEYIFLENIYSPLVEISASGSVEPGVAEKVEWIGDELKLTIRDSLKTISGKNNSWRCRFFAKAAFSAFGEHTWKFSRYSLPRNCD